MADKVDTLFPDSTSQSRADLVRLWRESGQSMTVADAQGADLTDYPYIFASDLAALFFWDLTSTASDDGGVTAIVDATGNRFLRAPTPSLFTYSGSGDPSSGLGENGDTYYKTATATVWVKEGGTWVEGGAIKGADGTTYYDPGAAQTVASGNVTEGQFYIDYAAAGAATITKVSAAALLSSGGSGEFVLRIKNEAGDTKYGPVTVQFGTPLDATVSISRSEGEALLMQLTAVDDVQGYVFQAEGTRT